MENFDSTAVANFIAVIITLIAGLSSWVHSRAEEEEDKVKVEVLEDSTVSADVKEFEIITGATVNVVQMMEKRISVLEAQRVEWEKEKRELVSYHEKKQLEWEAEREELKILLLECLGRHEGK